MNEQLLTEVTEIAATVARQIHPRYAVYFDAADLRQDLLLWALKRPDKIAGWLDPEQDATGRKAGIKQVAKSMRREAEKLCRTAKAKATGYEVRDEFFYSIGLIEEILPSISNPDNWTQSAQQTGNVRVSNGGSDPSTGNNNLVMIIDVRVAFSKLEPQDQMMLEMRYQEGLTYSQIGLALELSDTTVHRRITSALRRMVKELGGENPWPKREPVESA